MADAKPGKLPVWKTAIDCYRVTFRHLGDLLRFGWPWFIVLIGTSAILYWSLYPKEQEALAKYGSGSNVLWFSTLIASTTIGACIAVPWHRLLLLGEVQNSTTSTRVNAITLSYIMRALTIIVGFTLPLILFDYFMPGSADGATDTTATNSDLTHAILMTAAILTFFLAMLVAGRLSLILPATAVGHNDFSWAEAWAISRKNTWRLFWSSLGVYLPFVLAGAAVALSSVFEDSAALVSETPTREWYTLSSIGWELVFMLFGMLSVTFLSLAYRHFRGLPEPGGATATGEPS